MSTVWRHPKLGLGHETLVPAGADEVDVAALEAELRGHVRGEVAFDAGNRAAYAHDSSNYRQPPIGVVVPRDADDIVPVDASWFVRSGDARHYYLVVFQRVQPLKDGDGYRVDLRVREVE